VELPNHHQILAHAARKHNLDCQRLATGDQVIVQMSPYDLSKGCIVSFGK
jgi:translation initiation factor IF-1